MPDAEGHGPSEGLPDLPPHWGRVVIPDDASALAEEAAQLRRELRRQEASTRRPGDRRPLVLPALVLLVSLLTTVAALAAVTWPRSPRNPDRPGVPPSASTTPPDLSGRPLPALDLVDASQSPVPLRRLLPAMIILVDACACAEQITAATTAAPTGVTVVTVTGGRTVQAGAADGAHALADPAGGLRGALRLPPIPGT
ncbi:hypothetical protein E1193_22895, partial [Micromonospora sp. KC606]|uniref:hypothetical protein n=1 Tax=Micromonospora sp. KC606 TaxID=2530379 RepID=UPI00105165F0